LFGRTRSFDGASCQDGSGGDGVFEGGERSTILGGEVAEHAAGVGIAGAPVLGSLGGRVGAGGSAKRAVADAARQSVRLS